MQVQVSKVLYDLLYLYCTGISTVALSTQYTVYEASYSNNVPTGTVPVNCMLFIDKFTVHVQVPVLVGLYWAAVGYLLYSR